MGLSVNDVTGIGAVATLATDLIDRLFPNRIAQAKERAEYLEKAQELDNQLATGQMAIDQAEAASSSFFVAGARPFIMWVCGIAFLYHLLLQPLLTYLMAIFGHTFPLPVFDSVMLNDVLMGMLGLGTMRTVEKMGNSNNLPWQNKG